MTGIHELCPDCGGTKIKTSELSRNSEVFYSLAGALDGACPTVFVDGEVNRGYFQGTHCKEKGKLSDNNWYYFAK